MECSNCSKSIFFYWIQTCELLKINALLKCDSHWGHITTSGCAFIFNILTFCCQLMSYIYIYILILAVLLFLLCEVMRQMRHLNVIYIWSPETWSCIGHMHTSKVWTWHSYCIYLQKFLCVWSDNHSDGCVSFHLVYGLIICQVFIIKNTAI